jgi:hypothetical protein
MTMLRPGTVTTGDCVVMVASTFLLPLGKIISESNVYIALIDDASL